MGDIGRRLEGEDGLRVSLSIFDGGASLRLVASDTVDGAALRLDVPLVVDDTLELESDLVRPEPGERRLFEGPVDVLGPRMDVRATVPLWNNAVAVSARIEARTGSRLRAGNVSTFRSEILLGIFLANTATDAAVFVFVVEGSLFRAGLFVELLVGCM